MIIQPLPSEPGAQQAAYPVLLPFFCFFLFLDTMEPLSDPPPSAGVTKRRAPGDSIIVSKLPLFVLAELIRRPSIPDPVILSYLLMASSESTLWSRAGDSA